MRSLLVLTLVFCAPALAADRKSELASLLKGPLTPETLKDVVHEHHPEVKRCADARPADRRGVSGKVVVHFLIGKDGAVSDVRVASSEVSEPKLESCLVSAVKAWRFPRPKHSNVEVNFPFRVGPPAPATPGAKTAPREPVDKAPDESEPDVLK